MSFSLPSSTHPAPRWLRILVPWIRRLPRGRYPAMNWLAAHGRTEPFVFPLAITSDRLNFICHLNDGIAREACFMGFYESLESMLLRAVLTRGMTFVDAGANWGYFTLLAADCVGPEGTLLALEPHPELCVLLESNLQLNGLQNATALPVAVSHKSAEVTLTGFSAGGGNWGVSTITQPVEPGMTTFRVPGRPLPGILDEQGLGALDLLKIDIEGAEAWVLPTLMPGLSTGRYRRLLLELHPQSSPYRQCTVAELIRPILACGYRVYRIDHGGHTSRKASYRLPQTVSEFLSPLNLAEPLDAWPHLYLTAPGIRLEDTAMT